MNTSSSEEISCAEVGPEGAAALGEEECAALRRPQDGHTVFADYEGAPQTFYHLGYALYVDEESENVRFAG